MPAFFFVVTAVILALPVALAAFVVMMVAALTYRVFRWIRPLTPPAAKPAPKGVIIDADYTVVSDGATSRPRHTPPMRR